MGRIWGQTLPLPVHVLDAGGGQGRASTISSFHWIISGKALEVGTSIYTGLAASVRSIVLVTFGVEASGSLALQPEDILCIHIEMSCRVTLVLKCQTLRLKRAVVSADILLLDDRLGSQL